jgi:large subunit ribosomal protein L25
MEILTAEKRDRSVRAKQLKKAGLIPGNIYGSKLDEPLLIQLRENEVKKLLKTKTAGNTAMLQVEDKRYTVMIKELGKNPVGSRIEHLSLQSLADDRPVTGTARIVLKNREKVSNFIQQHVYEIPHRALPPNLVEETVLDLEGLPAGTSVKVKDLEIAQNDKIELLINPDSLVLSIVGSKKPAATH